MKLLLIEDEKELMRSIVAYSVDEGYVCTCSSTFADASKKINDYEYDCAVVDLTLPGGSGLDLIRQLKASQPAAGIIIISAKNSLDDKLTGLDLGADDYLTKPFHLAELNSRIKSVLRRRFYSGSSAIVINELRIEPEKHEVFVRDAVVPLTKKEFDILLYLATNKEKVLTKESILEHIWGDDAATFDSVDFVYTHMKNLRKKLVAADCRDYIRSIYGIGYKFSEQ
jgi:DNA-binding response OmpR family regulator